MEQNNVSGVRHQSVLANERMITGSKGQGDVDYNGMETDELAMALLPCDSDTYRAFKTRGDGNCLYNSVSLLLSGDLSKISLDLRVLVACEIFLNAELYAHHEHVSIAAANPKILTDNEDTLFSMLLTSDVATIFDRNRDRVEALQMEAINTCNDQAWSSMVHVLAMASVTMRRLNCVYPEVNDAIRPLFHAKLNPVIGSTNEEIAVMWSRDGDLSSTPGSFFEPNHFVALATLECEYSDSTNVKSQKRPREPVSNIDNESCDTGKNPHKKLKPGQANIKKYFEQQSHKEVVIGNWE
jgi:hypothetical protein